MTSTALASERASAVAVPVRAPTDERPLRWLVWLYLGLWVFEGALRKWFLPSLANPLLVVRDPVLLGLYALALAKGVFPRNAFIVWFAVLGVLAMVVSMGATDTPLLVELYGLRADYLHLPFIFLMAVVFRREDLRTAGKYALVLAVPMAVLVVLQFGSGASSRLNAGAGANSVMLESAFGHVRPSGTFSFTNGLSGFTSMAMAFFLCHLLEKRVFPRLIWLAALPALLVLIVLSGSRAGAAIIAILLTTVIGISLVQGRYRASAIKLAVLCAVGVMTVGSFAVFKQGLNVFSARFGNAANVQTGFVGRFGDTLLAPFTTAGEVGWGGMGLGMGTNVAAGLLRGKRMFMLAEGEGPRVMLENGPLIGGAFLLLRVSLMLYLGGRAFLALRRHAATLPLLLFSSCAVSVVIGQFAQATELGFVVIAAGLCLTASTLAAQPVLVPAGEVPEPSPERPQSRFTPALVPVPTSIPALAASAPAPSAPPLPSRAPRPVVVPPATRRLPTVRGRSAYAEWLHNRPKE